RSEVAVAEAGHLEGAWMPLEQRARTHAVADRAGADARRARWHLQEGIEGDDLVDLSPANVHVVGERVGELGRDRADLPPDSTEVVQQPRSLGRKLGQQRNE